MNYFENKAVAEKSMNRLSKESYLVREGSGVILVSAPHCVKHFSNGKLKFAEVQTGVLAEMLHSELNCHMIRKVSNCNDDANYDEVCKYKTTLSEYVKANGVKLVIDLHQLSPKRDIMICFGTGNWDNLNQKDIFNVFLKAFSKYPVGIVQLDNPFAGASEHTVCSTIHRVCGILCLQLEINSRLLVPKHEEYSFEVVYKALRECCIEAEKILTKEENL